MSGSADLSRAMSHALRHEPWLYELELDAEGWTSTEDLLTALRHDPRWREVTVDDLEDVVTNSAKRRHEIRGGRIRALYGHSMPDAVRAEPGVPPEVLFHGTASSSVATILRDGLKPMGRQYVHLSVDTAMAREVGARKGSGPVVLTVQAGRAAAAGVEFFVGNDRVWLAHAVPAGYLATT